MTRLYSRGERALLWDFVRSIWIVLLAVLCFWSGPAVYAEEETQAGQSYDTMEYETQEVSAEKKTDAVVVCVLDSGYGVKTAEKTADSEMPESAEDTGTAEVREKAGEITGWNYLDDSEDITDEQGHGTDVCTLIAENAPDAEIVMLKCFDAGMNSDGDAIVAALYAAVDDYQADVINMSWTISKPDEELFEAVQYAAARGAVLVASAGNLSLTTGVGSEVYPALWEEVIGIGGVDLDDEGNPISSLWYLAGEAVYICTCGEYGDGKGSSYASARISGVVAAYLEEWPETDADINADVDMNPDVAMGSDIGMGPDVAMDSDIAMDPDANMAIDAGMDARIDAVRQMLRDNAVDLGESGYDTTYGWGYVETK